MGKRKVAGVFLVLCAFAAIAAGAYALGESALKGTSPEVLLHDDFKQGVNKDVYSENIGSTDMYVRIQFKEYLEIEDENILGGTPGMGLPEAEYREAVKTWHPHTYGESGCTLDSHNYFTWVQDGGSKTYKPGQSGLPEENYIGEDKKETFSAELPVYMTDWLKKSDDEKLSYYGWILDDTNDKGYAYWSQPLAPGDATNLLLNNVLISGMDKDYNYTIEVIQEAIPVSEHISLSTQSFANNMKKLTELASEYMTANPADAATEAQYTNGKEAWLPFMYLRQLNPSYVSDAWAYTGGAVDAGFVSYVGAQDATLAEYFKQLINVDDVDIKHMAAAMSALMFKTTKSPVMGMLMTEKQFNDLAGWAGDLQTFVDYVTKNKVEGTDEEYFLNVTKENLGKSGTTFDMSDFYADIDAENIYALIGGGKTVAEAIDEYYTPAVIGSGVDKRMDTYREGLDVDSLADKALAYTKENYLHPNGITSSKWLLYSEMNTTVNAVQSAGIAKGYAEFVFSISDGKSFESLFLT